MTDRTRKPQRSRFTWRFAIPAALVALASFAWAQEIGVGTVSGFPGHEVSLAVTLDASADPTATLMQVVYDSTALEEPAATAGSLLTEDHALSFHSPEAGKMNVMVFDRTGAAALSGRTGELCTLHFKVSDSAPEGWAEIVLEGNLSEALVRPASQAQGATRSLEKHGAVRAEDAAPPTLVDTSGALHPLTSAAGGVQVKTLSRFGATQVFRTSSDGQYGIALYYYSRGAYSYRETWGESSQTWDNRPNEWTGAFLYDYATGQWARAIYVYGQQPL